MLRKSLKSSFGLMVSGARLQWKNGNITQDAHVSRCSGECVMLRRAPENPATFTQNSESQGVTLQQNPSATTLGEASH
jgi:hypothetical protein